MIIKWTPMWDLEYHKIYQLQVPRSFFSKFFWHNISCEHHKKDLGLNGDKFLELRNLSPIFLNAHKKSATQPKPKGKCGNLFFKIWNFFLQKTNYTWQKVSFFIIFFTFEWNFTLKICLIATTSFSSPPPPHPTPQKSLHTYLTLRSIFCH
jgi:hypothetical protein